MTCHYRFGGENWLRRRTRGREFAFEQPTHRIDIFGHSWAILTVFVHKTVTPSRKDTYLIDIHESSNFGRFCTVSGRKSRDKIVRSEFTQDIQRYDSKENLSEIDSRPFDCVRIQAHILRFMS